MQSLLQGYSVNNERCETGMRFELFIKAQVQGKLVLNQVTPFEKFFFCVFVRSTLKQLSMVPTYNMT